MSFFIVFTALLFMIYLYTGLRLIPACMSRTSTLTAAWILMALAFLFLMVHLYFRIYDLYPYWSRIFAWIGYSGLGLVFCLFCLSIIRDSALLFHWIFQKTRRKNNSLSAEDTKFQANRRTALIKMTGYCVSAIGAGASGIGMTQALQKPKVIRINIPVQEEQKGLRGLRILQFTDLHVGPTIGREYVEPTCRLMQNEKADIIVFTGDLADGSPVELANDIAPIRRLTAPLGKYFVTGNHEYYSNAEVWIKTAQALGFHTLLNEHRVIRRNGAELTLAGVTDAKAGRFIPEHQSSPEKALKRCPENSYKILLAHQPISVYEAAPAGADLVLSGHTHGGQIFPFNYFIFLEHPFVKGMYQYQTTRLYVSQGIGYWGPPMRLGTFPEITVFKFI